MGLVRLLSVGLAGLAITNITAAQTSPHTEKHLPHVTAVQVKSDAHSMDKHGQSMMGCEMMMQKRQHMQMTLKTMDSKLDKLVARMNSASAADKTAAITAVVNELVSQRAAMRSCMSSMQTDMMQHMMSHMQMGKQSGMKCPMMQAEDAGSGSSHNKDEHSSHH